MILDCERFCTICFGVVCWRVCRGMAVVWTEVSDLDIIMNESMSCVTRGEIFDIDKYCMTGLSLLVSRECVDSVENSLRLLSSRLWLSFAV